METKNAAAPSKEEGGELNTGGTNQEDTSDKETSKVEGSVAGSTYISDVLDWEMAAPSVLQDLLMFNSVLSLRQILLGYYYNSV